MNDSEKIEKIREYLKKMDTTITHEDIENEIINNNSPKETVELVCDMFDYFKDIKNICG